ncbi:MAG: hypothetical protein JW779_03625 [Candidatus Thorarchaeota archaeon]|nr:hypothetical protein [Candidatus Thorarchaeota archaeon]
MIYVSSILSQLMKIICEECESEDWKIKLHEIDNRGLKAYYVALECTTCGMVYPLEKLAVKQRGITIEDVRSYLKESITQSL